LIDIVLREAEEVPEGGEEEAKKIYKEILEVQITTLQYTAWSL
jgi:hypothetical protein